MLYLVLHSLLCVSVYPSTSLYLAVPRSVALSIYLALSLHVQTLPAIVALSSTAD